MSCHLRVSRLGIGPVVKEWKAWRAELVICAQPAGLEPDNFLTGLICAETVRNMSNEMFVRHWLSERHKMHSLCLIHRWA